MGDLMTLDEMRRHEWVVPWSGGKDSTATVILMHEHQIPIKRIVYVRMMWDDEMPATLPVMTEFVDRAAGVFRDWGYEVLIVKSYRTAKELCNGIIHKSIFPQRNGKRYGLGAFGRGRCYFTSIKTRTVRRCTAKGDYTMIGYAADETKRTHRLGGMDQSIMVTLGVKEAETYAICREYGILSPLYELGFYRDGCFFCPNCTRLQRLYLHEHYPELVRDIYKEVEGSGVSIQDKSKYPNAWFQDYYATGGIVGNVKPWHQQMKLLI